MYKQLRCCSVVVCKFYTDVLIGWRYGKNRVQVINRYLLTVLIGVYAFYAYLMYWV